MLMEAHSKCRRLLHGLRENLDTIGQNCSHHWTAEVRRPPYATLDQKETLTGCPAPNAAEYMSCFNVETEVAVKYIFLLLE